MKLGGRALLSPQPEVLVIPRPKTMEPQLSIDGQPVLDQNNQPVMVEVNNDVVFLAKAVLDFSEFNKIVPDPSPPMVLRRGDKESTPNFDDKDYRKALMVKAGKQTNYMILESLKATPDLEWETVKPEDPETWGNWAKELSEAGLTDRDISRVIEIVTTANSLNEEKYKEAKQSFLATRGRQK